MAKPPITDEELIARYGPHLNEAPPGGWEAGLEIDRVVTTHCCFCGQQCGIKLKVHDNQVVGFEPWYDFPFNEGKLCPKGVKRYLQGSHPDRVVYPMERDDTAPGGFRRVSWDHVLDRVVAEIRRIQETVSDRFGMTVNELCSAKRSQAIAYPRQVAMYLSRALTDSSLPKIGKEFGGRDHTTVMHANAKIEWMIREDRSVYNLVQELTARIKQAG